MDLSRRAILSGLITAPAVVAVGNIMPVRLWDPYVYVSYNLLTDSLMAIEPGFGKVALAEKMWRAGHVERMRESAWLNKQSRIAALAHNPHYQQHARWTS